MRRNDNVVRRLLSAFDNDAEAFRDTIHSEIEWFPFEHRHSPTYGVENAMRVRKRWLDTWDEHHIQIQEVIEEGGEVLASVRLTARGKASGVEVAVCLHLHYKLRDEKVVYIFEHQDKETALEAAGIGEGATRQAAPSVMAAGSASDRRSEPRRLTPSARCSD